ncbi:YigZ family protein [Acinetobacter sp. B5B]|uniref:IMPACT family protein n=1 Tax=Acinetobacter baretiae TaxID=2605383 RepID=UPI0018C25D9D|nr:YigZ family protein [Acinetobacter baretiae]MBF7682144.1 YigZ family protein [Acinetobacter baretiae]
MPFTILDPVVYEEDIKKSRFQAYVIPVETEEDVKMTLEEYQDHSTTHQCWAWKIGHNVRINDDGEPSGTAGRPILATIEGNELTNILVLVNRWYGGVKLGTGGLVRAYGGTAGKALLLAEKIALVEKIDVYFECNFSEWPILQYELLHQQIVFTQEYLISGVKISAKIQHHQQSELAQKIQDVTRGRERLKGVDHDR